MAHKCIPRDVSGESTGMHGRVKAFHERRDPLSVLRALLSEPSSSAHVCDLRCTPTLVYNPNISPKPYITPLW